MKRIYLFTVLITFYSCTSIGVSLHTNVDAKFAVSEVKNNPQTIIDFSYNLKEISDIYQFNGQECSIKEFFKNSRTTSFIVLQGENIVFEKYFLDTNENTFFLSNSMAKSITSAMIGLALESKLIGNLDDNIVLYLPELIGSGYDGVTVRNLLHMCSGIKYNEGGGLPRANLLNLLSYIRTFQKPALQYLSEMKRGFEPGTSFRYASVDTLVLGLLLNRVTGVSSADFLSEHIWKKIGAESNAYWSADHHGQELNFGFLYAKARDYLRFGKLFRDKGVVNGVRVLPEAWIDLSTTARQGDGPDNLLPGNADDKDEEDWGYQYQWWQFPDAEDGAYCAVGVFGQYIYINPVKDIVIVRTAFEPQTPGRERYERIEAVFKSVVNNITNKDSMITSEE
jgi:CubicO group peptidase (beta-lactamase class C family)